MKNSMIKLTVILFLGVGVFSCEKEKTSQPEQTEVSNTLKTNWSVPINDLELELETLFSEKGESWKELGIENNDYLLIEREEEKANFYLLSNLENQNMTKKIVCEGSGYSFATCSKDWLAANPERCLTIWQVGDTYYASDDCTIP